ncbi:VIR protein [Plasmodium vivax]|uniref:VIR protein n=1 Tax=Plasmodium vivax TaxID=5855 RepID=A0A1G4E4Z3_PLAVI|nr:VIR protein [Plasmodium vivax]
MTNHCNGSHDQYLSYDCYNYLSEKLDAPKLSKENEVHLENALKFLGKEQYNKYNKYPKHKAIDNLAARITQDGLFYYSHNTKVACNYINYKLNETLRTHYNHIYTEDYNIFKKLVKEFYNKRHNNSNSQKPCESYIKHMDDDIYKRLTILYKIYYHYNELKRPNNYIYSTSNDKLCDNLNLLVRYSNDAIKENIIKEETIELIKELKKIIENDDADLKYRRVCGLDVLKGMSTKLPNSNVPISREEEPALVPDVALRTQQPHELEHRREDTANVQAQRKHETNEDPEREIESTDERAMGPAPQQRVEREQVSPNLAARVQEPRIQVNRFQAGMHPGITRQVSNDQEIRGQLDGLYISQESEAPTSGKEGMLVKMQGFFTDTLGQVEPAPILVVSGGMGALFLLFKYTPVGSFFGRRRGLNHRIPGGFPGAYPGFPEYYDSNFGNIPINISYQAE